MKTLTTTALAVASLCLAACSGGVPNPTGARADADSPARADDSVRVVVAVIDSTINPYHEHFHAGSEIYADSAPSSVTPELLEAFGIGPEHVLAPTRTGDFAADFAADQAFFRRHRAWSGGLVQRHQYHCDFF